MICFLENIFFYWSTCSVPFVLYVFISLCVCVCVGRMTSTSLINADVLP